MNAKRYEIQDTERVYMLELSKWKKMGRSRIYVKLSRYGVLGYYDVNAGQYVIFNKKWKKIGKKSPELSNQITESIKNYRESEWDGNQKG